MIFYRFILIIVFIQLLGSSHLNAQQLGDRAIFYLKDGSVFTGEVVESLGRAYRLVLVTKDTITLELGMVKKKLTLNDDVAMRSRGKFHYKNGYFASLNMGFSLNPNSESSQLNLIVGKRLNEKISLGVLMGYHNNTSFTPGFWFDHYFYSLAAYGRYYIGKSNVGFYADMGLGYSFPTNQNVFFFDDRHTGGPIIQPGLGFHFASRKKIRWFVGMAQNIQHSRGENSRFDSFNNPVFVEYDVWHNSVILKFGIEFR